MGRTTVLLFCAFAATAQAPHRGPDPILDRVVDAYTNVQGYQTEVVTTTRVVGEPSLPQHRNLFVAYGAPDRLRLEDEDTKEITAYHDRGVAFSGKRGTGFIAPPERSPQQPPPPPMQEQPPLRPDQDLPMPGAIIPGKSKTNRTDPYTNDYTHRSQAIAKIGLTDYTAIEKELKSAHLLRQEKITVDGSGVPCSVVEATYPHEETRTFWIDTRSYAVVREVDLLRGEGPTKGKQVEHTIAVQSIIWDQPSPQSLFDLRSAMIPRNPGTAAYLARHPDLNGAFPPHPVRPCQSHLDTPESKIARLSGGVGVAFTVSTDGSPTDVHITQPLGLGVDELAAQCVSLSQWLPAEKDGKPIEWKLESTLFATGDRTSDWSLGRAQFLPPAGASRPEFLKTKYPAPQGAQGRMVVPVRLTIDKEGIPRNVEIVSPGMPKLDKMAVNMVSAWRFKPGQKDGQPVEVPANFDLVCSGGPVVISKPPSK